MCRFAMAEFGKSRLLHSNYATLAPAAGDDWARARRDRASPGGHPPPTWSGEPDQSYHRQFAGDRTVPILASGGRASAPGGVSGRAVFAVADANQPSVSNHDSADEYRSATVADGALNGQFS